MFKQSLGALVLSCLASTAIAQDKSFYVGLKYGSYTFDDSELSSIADEGFNVDLDDQSTGAGLLLGYKLSPTWSLQIEYGTSNHDLVISDDESTLTVDMDFSSYGLYAAYRSSGALYFLGKAGIVRNEIEGKFTNIETNGVEIDPSILGSDLEVAVSETDLSFGLGGGYRVSESFAIELEYTVLDADYSYLSLNATLDF